MTRSLLALPLLLAVALPAAGQQRYLHSFTKQQLSDRFHAEGANVGDFNRDGVLDLVAGPYWWAGPDFRERHTYAPVREFDPERYSDNFFAHAYDFDRDGWEDIFIIGFPGEEASWYRNPGRGAQGEWQRHVVFRGVDNESPAWTDLTGDGRPEMVFISGGRYGWAGPGTDPTLPWTFHPISEQGGWKKFTHGLGVGDVNRDGRQDVIHKDGWWEQPASLGGNPLWRWHPASFGPGGSQMHAYDLDGDGDNDIISGLRAHGYGLAWWEQTRRAGRVEWVQHTVMDALPEQNAYGLNFSGLHAVELADMDGDGVRDIVTGKRHWAHGSRGDVDPDAPSVVYWFRTVRQRSGAVELVPYRISEDAGVGVQLVVRDLDGDRLPDLVIGNKRGTVVLRHTRRVVGREEWERGQPRRNGRGERGSSGP